MGGPHYRPEPLLRPISTAEEMSGGQSLVLCSANTPDVIFTMSVTLGLREYIYRSISREWYLLGPTCLLKRRNARKMYVVVWFLMTLFTSRVHVSHEIRDADEQNMVVDSGCVYNGTRFPDDTVFVTDDPCVTCECRLGAEKFVCRKTHCPTLHCVDWKTTSKTECCHQCEHGWHCMLFYTMSSL